MSITIKGDDFRFGVRIGAIIFNKEHTKIFMQRQGTHDYYMFPGGRLEVHEESKVAILRELEEELGIKENINLKYIAESFIKFPKLRYHEIGFYYMLVIDEEKYGYFDDVEYDSLDEENDGKSKFCWIKIEDLNNTEIVPNFIKEKILSNEIFSSSEVENIIYREYE